MRAFSMPKGRQAHADIEDLSRCTLHHFCASPPAARVDAPRRSPGRVPGDRGSRRPALVRTAVEAGPRGCHQVVPGMARKLASTSRRHPRAHGLGFPAGTPAQPDTTSRRMPDNGRCWTIVRAPDGPARPASQPMSRVEGFRTVRMSTRPMRSSCHHGPTGAQLRPHLRRVSPRTGPTRASVGAMGSGPGRFVPWAAGFYDHAARGSPKNWLGRMRTLNDPFGASKTRTPAKVALGLISVE